MRRKVADYLRLCDADNEHVTGKSSAPLQTVRKISVKRADDKNKIKLQTIPCCVGDGASVQGADDERVQSVTDGTDLGRSPESIPSHGDSVIGVGGGHGGEGGGGVARGGG